MIVRIKINNCFTFNKSVEFNLKADMRTKRFSYNIWSNNDISIIKSAIIYGPNNTGKTAFMSCVKAIKEVFLNDNIHLKSNIFNKSNICELGLSYIYDNDVYDYEFKYDDVNREFVYEKLIRYDFDNSGREKDIVIFEKDTIKKVFRCDGDSNLNSILSIASRDNLLIYTLDSDKFSILKSVRKMLVDVANNMEIVDMNNIPNKKTIELLKVNDARTKKIVDFIKNADLYLDEYRYEDNPKLDVEMDIDLVDENILNNQNVALAAKLVSVYNGKAVSSIQFDSVGTRKFAALSSYIIECLEEGKTLFVDELDSSLHSKITRAIISMFNNSLNSNAQLIATLHDISLLDCKRMFRKEQIWFTDKDRSGCKLYSLKEFNYVDSGVRETSDIQDRYNKGIFGAVPNPDLINCLLGAIDND